MILVICPLVQLFGFLVPGKEKGYRPLSFCIAAMLDQHTVDVPTLAMSGAWLFNLNMILLR